jgi:hypothetical protein
MSRTRIVVIITLGLVLLGTVVVPLVGAEAPVECVLAIPEPQRLWFCRGIHVNASDDTYVCEGTVEPGEQGIITMAAGRVEFTDVTAADLSIGLAPLTCSGFFAGAGEVGPGEHCQFTCTPQ